MAEEEEHLGGEKLKLKIKTTRSRLDVEITGESTVREVRRALETRVCVCEGVLRGQ